MNAPKSGTSAEQRTQRIMDIIVRWYMNTGEGLTAAEIAAGTGITTSTVRRMLKDRLNGICPGVKINNFAQRVFVFTPTREALRYIIAAKDRALTDLFNREPRETEETEAEDCERCTVQEGI